MSKIDDTIANIFINLLGDTTPEECRETILLNKQIMRDISDDKYSQYRKIMIPIQKYLKGDIDYLAVVNAMDKNRPDLLAVICSTEGGIAWLKSQVETGRQKLGLSET
jgi:hypothetical protein